MPTETVYGLAADATADAAVAGIFAAKGRPAFNPLITHVLDVGAASEYATFGRDAERLVEAFWPGPLTLVLPAVSTCRVSLLARAGLETLALRAPSHPTARALIEAAGVPLAAPSANRSGRVSPTTAAHVLADLDGKIDWILDDGSSRHGLESTIVACLETPALLRPGAITREAIVAVLGSPLGSSVVDGGAPDPQGGWNRITRRAPACGSRRRRSGTTKPRLISPGLSRTAGRSPGSTFRPPGTLSRPRRTCSRICGHSTPRERGPSRRPPFLIEGWASPSTTDFSGRRPREERDGAAVRAKWFCRGRACGFAAMGGRVQPTDCSRPRPP